MSITDLLPRGVDRGIPLALSGRQGRRHYDPIVETLSGRIMVLLDGESMDQVVSYDVPAGEVVRQRRDWQGRLLLDDQGRPALETFIGAVEVRWRPGKALP